VLSRPRFDRLIGHSAIQLAGRQKREKCKRIAGEEGEIRDHDESLGDKGFPHFRISAISIAFAGDGLDAKIVAGSTMRRKVQSTGIVRETRETPFRHRLLKLRVLSIYFDKD